MPSDKEIEAAARSLCEREGMIWESGPPQLAWIGAATDALIAAEQARDEQNDLIIHPSKQN